MPEKIKYYSDEKSSRIFVDQKNAMKTTAIAHANIALVKYWGKRDETLNLPAAGSISITLRDLFTKTSVEFRENLKNDILILNGERANPKQESRSSKFLDLIRKMADTRIFAEITSENNFPTGAGLASSASGFAALAVAASHAAGLSLPPARLSELSRRGSGSAARSIFGGFVEMKKGEKADGSDSVAFQLYDEHYWPLDMLILITSAAEKEIGSTEGMNLTAETSPYYRSWVTSSPADLEAMREAITWKDFQQLGEISEYSCFKMHGLALSARPGLLYWNQLTVTLIHEIRRLRRQGIPAYVTIDAGPQVKVICLPEYSEQIRQELSQIPGIGNIFKTSTGPGAKISKEEHRHQSSL
jgi:diphosphomevalonate decarboxylase